MKKFLTFCLLSIISIPAIAQTAEELEAQLVQLQNENQSLTLQSNNYDIKIKEKEKEQTETEANYNKLQTKYNLSREACKSISESDLKLMNGLSAGTVAMSFVGTAAGVVKNTGAIDKMTIGKKDKTEQTDEQQDENSQTEPTLQKAKTSDKIINIGTTVTSAGSTITSAIALSKAKKLKEDIQKCVESFD